MPPDPVAPPELLLVAPPAPPLPPTPTVAETVAEPDEDDPVEVNSSPPQLAVATEKQAMRANSRDRIIESVHARPMDVERPAAGQVRTEYTRGGRRETRVG